MKRKAPQKKCPSCNGTCHARSSSCSCGHIFYRKQLSVITDWNSLDRGDKIKSVKGHGSFWIDPETKEKTYMGVYGKLIVRKVVHNGVIASKIERGVKSGLTEFVYMGSPHRSDLMDNYHIRPHKLVWDKKVKLR